MRLSLLRIAAIGRLLGLSGTERAPSKESTKQRTISDDDDADLDLAAGVSFGASEEWLKLSGEVRRISADHKRKLRERHAAQQAAAQHVVGPSAAHMGANSGAAPSREAHRSAASGTQRLVHGGGDISSLAQTLVVATLEAAMAACVAEELVAGVIEAACTIAAQTIEADHRRVGRSYSSLRELFAVTDSSPPGVCEAAPGEPFQPTSHEGSGHADKRHGHAGLSASKLPSLLAAEWDDRQLRPASFLLTSSPSLLIVDKAAWPDVERLMSTLVPPRQLLRRLSDVREKLLKGTTPERIERGRARSVSSNPTGSVDGLRPSHGETQMAHPTRTQMAHPTRNPSNPIAFAPDRSPAKTSGLAYCIPAGGLWV